MKFNKICVYVLAGCLLAASLSGCQRNLTPEEIAASSLAAVEAEENTTGMRRLDSPNLADYEKPLANFVSGIQSMDADAVADALGSINVFGDTLNSWIISNNYESLQTIDLHEIQIESEKDGKNAVIKVYFEAPNEEKDNYVEYTSEYDGTKWAVTPPSGLVTDYVFYAPVSKVSVNGVDVSSYASSDSSYGCSFTIPRMVETDNEPTCTLTTSLGEYSGKIEIVSTSWGSNTAIAMAQFTDAQKKEANQNFVSCASGVIELMKSGAAQGDYSKYILDSSAITDVVGKDEEATAAIVSAANEIQSIEASAASAAAGTPEDYVYRFTSSDEITMDIKYNAILNSGECHRLATVTMIRADDTWKIKKISSTNSLFTNLSAFNPEW